MSTDDLVAGYTRYTTAGELSTAADGGMGVALPTTTILISATTTLPTTITITPIG